MRLDRKEFQGAPCFLWWKPSCAVIGRRRLHNYPTGVYALLLNALSTPLSLLPAFTLPAEQQICLAQC